MGLVEAFANGLLRITLTRRPPGVRLEGEIDMTNAPAVRRALAAVIESHPDLADLHVDLERLEFIDVEGLRLLVDTARKLAGGRRLVLRATPPYLSTMLSLANWEQTPGLRVRGGVAP